jgi:hypothetical protein
LKLNLLNFKIVIYICNFFIVKEGCMSSRLENEWHNANFASFYG